MSSLKHTEVRTVSPHKSRKWTDSTGYKNAGERSQRQNQMPEKGGIYKIGSQSRKAYIVAKVATYQKAARRTSPDYGDRGRMISHLKGDDCNKQLM